MSSAPAAPAATGSHAVVSADEPARGVGLQTVLDGLPAFVAYCDRDLRTRYVNRSAQEWLGRTAEECAGVPLRDLLGPEHHEMARPHLEAVLTGEDRQFQRTTLAADGRPVYTQTQYRAHVVEGRVVGVHLLVVDITRHVMAKASLQEAITRGALHEDRARIAADLHDRVVQQLFAAGLGLNRALKRPEQGAEIIRSALELLDSAITDLRGSIHELHRDVDATSMHKAIDRVVADASLSLGFTPDVEHADCPEELPASIAQEVLAVLTEALSNVVRHAHAAHVSVHVSTNATGLHLYVVDDGVGVSATGRRSGLANMRTRAERLGGSFSLVPQQPTGTMVSWHIPLPPDEPTAFRA